MANKITGFTLIELSIVLVIIGLMVGGIVGGKALIHQAELQSVVRDFNTFQTAVYGFQSQYEFLPGDLPDATAYWGAADGNDGRGNDCYNATSANGSTCNGNGNGMIHHHDSGDTNNNTAKAHEWFHAWVQLKNAELVTGTFTGRGMSGTPRQAMPGVNIPASRLKGLGYTLMSIDTYSGVYPNWYEGVYNPMIMFGQTHTLYETFMPGLTGRDAFALDSKADNGKPGTGRVRTYFNDSNCVTPTGAANQETASYNRTTDTIACQLIYALNKPGT